LLQVKCPERQPISLDLRFNLPNKTCLPGKATGSVPNAFISSGTENYVFGKEVLKHRYEVIKLYEMDKYDILNMKQSLRFMISFLKLILTMIPLYQQ